MDSEKLLMWLTVGTTIVLILAIGLAYLGMEQYNVTGIRPL